MWCLSRMVDLMRIGVLCTLVSALPLLTAAAAAQDEPQAFAGRPTTFVSGDEIRAKIAANKNGHDTVLALPPYRLSLQYRTGEQTALMHKKDAELVFVLEGSGIFTMGGTLDNAKMVRPDNFSGTGITGGTPFKVEKGAVIFVPENTPHQFSGINGELDNFELHVPRVGQSGMDSQVKSLVSAEEVGKLIAAEKNDTLVAQPPYRVVLQYRTGSQTALMHQKDAEFVYILQGSGTFVIGGTLDGAKPTTPGNFSGTGITGGKRLSVEKGAAIFVPENTPHQFTDIHGVLVSADLHMPPSSAKAGQ